ncbi:hypothetical protein H8E77_12305 [bacterium]|nr:hypothetical protein [bacterium]
MGMIILADIGLELSIFPVSPPSMVQGRTGSGVSERRLSRLEEAYRNQAEFVLQALAYLLTWFRYSSPLRSELTQPAFAPLT